MDPSSQLRLSGNCTPPAIRIDTSLATLASRPSSITSLLNPDPVSQSIVTNECPSNQTNFSRRYSVPNMPKNFTNDLTIINYTGKSRDGSHSIPSSPTTKGINKFHPDLPSTSLSLPTKPHSDLILTPPTTPAVKSPTKTNFQFPANDNGGNNTTAAKSSPKSNFQFPANNNSGNNTGDQNHQAVAPKVKRKRITQEQLVDLLSMFEQTDTPSYDVREKLAQKLTMTNREVQVWFQNRRAKTNRAKANEQNASHQHHRFLHHHSVTTTQAASGHASSVMMHNGNFTFVPVSINGSSTSGQSKGRSTRRHSYQTSALQVHSKKANQGSSRRPRATTVSLPYTTQPSMPPATTIPETQSTQTFSPLKILPYEQPQRQPPQASSVHQFHSPSLPLSPCSPKLPSTPITLPPISVQYAVPNLGPYMSQAPTFRYHELSQPMITTQRDLETAKFSPESAIDILATAAEYVQSEEMEKQRAMSLSNDTDSRGAQESHWRPWMV